MTKKPGNGRPSQPNVPMVVTRAMAIEMVANDTGSQRRANQRIRPDAAVVSG